MSLSAAIAVHNEENNIIRTLESVYDWVDEIIIVDGASTDRTLEVIRLFEENRLRESRQNTKKIQILNESHEAMFHKNKQKAIEKCTKDWILQLDADEVVSEELKEEIIQKTEDRRQKKEAGNIAYWIPRLNYFLGRPLRKGGQYPDYTLRFYKKGVANFPCKSIHENVEITISTGGPTGGGPKKGATPTSVGGALFGTRVGQAPSTLIGHLKAPLLHYPYPTFSAYLDKWSRYALLEAEILYKKGVKPSAWNFILYMLIYPKWWFFWTYIRHKGFADGMPGFVFSLFSAIRFCVTYTKLYELHRHASQT